MLDCAHTAHAQSADRELLAANPLRPFQAYHRYIGFAFSLRVLTQTPARGDGFFQNGAHGSVHAAQEEFEIRRAAGLQQGVEEVHILSCVCLGAVAQEVRHDGLVVGKVGAQRDGYGLANLEP